MAPTSLLQNTTLDRTRLSSWSPPFEGALRQMDLVDRADPATEKVARKTIELARHRESVMLFGCGSVSLKPCQAHRRTQSLILGRGRVSIQECYGRNETY